MKIQLNNNQKFDFSDDYILYIENFKDKIFLNVELSSMKLIDNFCQYYDKLTDAERKSLKTINEYPSSSFATNLAKLKISEISVLLNIASELKIPALENMCSLIIAEFLENDVDKIRAEFGISNTNTPEERSKLKEEIGWITK